MIILQNPSGESNVRDPRKIIITEKDREKEREGEKEREREREREKERREEEMEDRFDGCRLISREASRENREPFKYAAPLSRADMSMTSDPIRMQIRVVCAVIEP